jgi:hypothetical protein
VPQQVLDGVKGQLLTELREQIAMETLQCRPIQGIDLPIKQCSQSAILQIEEIENRPMEVISQQGLLEMLLPGEIRPAA